jgi:hypothetical protein
VTVLILIQAATAAAAIAALIVTLITIQNRIDTIQTAREDAAVSSCHLLRAVVLAATPPDHRSAAVAFIDRTSLRDCSRYGHLIKQGAP